MVLQDFVRLSSGGGGVLRAYAFFFFLRGPFESSTIQGLHDRSVNISIKLL